MYRATFAIVDLLAFAHNLALLHRQLSSGTRMMLAVKANAYGHGIEPIMRVVERSQVTSVAVATLEEAVMIRDLGYTLPILVLGALGVSELAVAAKLDIEVTYADTWGDLRMLPRFECPLRVHLELDTGMNRMGIKASAQMFAVIEQLNLREDMLWVGTYTHLATADAPTDSLAIAQVNRFRDVLDALRRDGVVVPDFCHVSNSAGALRNSSWHFDMVRIGIAAYGYSPDKDVVPLPGLLPVMHVYSAVTRIAMVDSGEHIGYGATYQAHRRMRLATISIGYADGIMRLLSNRGMVMIRGVRAPIVGRVCMDQLMVDVSAIDDVQTGDFVTLFGYDVPDGLTAQAWRESAPVGREQWIRDAFFRASGHKRKELSLSEVAARAETIPYEVVCQISSRVPRLYL